MELEMGRSIKGLYNKQMNYQIPSSIAQPGEYPPPPGLGCSREIYSLEKWDQTSTGLKGTRSSRGVEGGTVNESLDPEKRDRKFSSPLSSHKVGSQASVPSARDERIPL